ncbi:MAG: sigma-54 interaction domain-containing protein, partial [Bdellovibrionota bacterium]
TPLSRGAQLVNCDRIEWAREEAAVFLASESATPTASENSDAMKSLHFLQNLAGTLQATGSVQAGLHQTLDALVEMANAESGYLLSDAGPGWELLATARGAQASLGQARASRRELISNTILQEALQKRAPVYVENIIGHPWSEAASVIEARIFSAACFPLMVGERVLGAVFLLTCSPGRSVRREVLFEANLLATQAALMLASAAELRSARRENSRLRELVQDWPTQLKYDPASQSMAELDRKITKLAGTPLSVLLLGETGTGKDVVAREIHGRSARAAKPLVAVNCAAIPATLLESTLFGYEKGAFTGAERAQPGKFMQAQGGTLFLDEIGDLPLELQAKLLRVLQDRKVEPLGAREAVAVDIRILAATHQNLEEAVRSGRFRQDLYFRLNGATIKIPPLRERRGDILPLAQHFLARAGAELKLSCDAIEALQMHPWPGNVRELEQVITRAGLLAEGTEIQVSDLELQKENPGATDYSLGSFATLEEAQLAFTRDFVERALERSGGNRAETAQSLGVSERTLYRILRSDSVVSGD